MWRGVRRSRACFEACLVGTPTRWAAPFCTDGLPAGLDVDRRVKYWAEKKQGLGEMEGREVFHVRPPRQRRTDEVLLETSPEQMRLAGEIKYLGGQRRWQEALSLFSAVSEPEPKLRTAMVDACCKAFEVSAARRLFDEMPAKTQGAYASLIGLLGRVRQIHEAERLLADMKAASMEPDEVSFTSLIMGYGMVGDVLGAVRTLRDMQAAGMQLDQVSYGATLTACGRAGDFQRARELLTEMDQQSVQVHVGHVTSLVTSCARSKDFARAREAFAELRNRGIRPDSVAYTSLIACLEGPDSLPKAEEVLAEMRSAGVAPHIFFYNEMLRIAKESGGVDRFHELYNEMRSNGLQENNGTRAQVREMERRQRRSVKPLGEEAISRPAHASTEELPPGWLQATDPASGRPYYWQASDPAGTTTWTRP